MCLPVCVYVCVPGGCVLMDLYMYIHGGIHGGVCCVGVLMGLCMYTCG